jgi:hypothetical protein
MGRHLSAGVSSAEGKRTERFSEKSSRYRDSILSNLSFGSLEIRDTSVTRVTNISLLKEKTWRFLWRFMSDHQKESGEKKRTMYPVVVLCILFAHWLALSVSLTLSFCRLQHVNSSWSSAGAGVCWRSCLDRLEPRTLSKRVPLDYERHSWLPDWRRA